MGLERESRRKKKNFCDDGPPHAVPPKEFFFFSTASGSDGGVVVRQAILSVPASINSSIQSIRLPRAELWHLVGTNRALEPPSPEEQGTQTRHCQAANCSAGLSISPSIHVVGI